MKPNKSYDPKQIENHWYAQWENQGYFKPSFNTQSDSYCIFLPPPNVTGTLHMGHGFQQTLMDALIRYHRMQGDNTLWQAGTDHAGIATQIVVERQLREQGLDRRQMGREAFTKAVWQWKEESGTTITRQMRRLGSSCDWSRERFTLDSGLSDSVQEVFIRLHQEGLIYRGQRLVNWDPQLQTAVSDLEVVSEEENGHLWLIGYPLVNGSDKIIVATTRPETLLGDQAICVHPDDERYQHLHGQRVHLPLTDRTIPIIADEYVDPTFGTGCVKITPAHDFNDYQVGLRHQLTPLNILTPQGTLNEAVPKSYQGLDRFIARQKILEDLTQKGFLKETRPHRLMVPRGDRSGQIIEPFLSFQWFLSMDGLARRGLDLVEQGQIRFVPENWTHTYNHWLNNIQDWCISRQLWWGHRIPAWYDNQGHIYVAKTLEEAQALAGSKHLTQDEDVLDTWFSSALWPFSTLGWPNPTSELKTFLPSQVLVTGFDIIFFWVARMIMLTDHFTGTIPFREVFVTGLVRDSEGQKMSKSKGNILDPLDIIDGIDLESLVQKRTKSLMDPKQSQKIEERTRKEYPEGIRSHGTDALRFTFASLATHGRDIRFDLKRCEGYHHFCNKLWNASRFVMLNAAPDQPETIAITQQTWADCWIQERLNETIAAIHEGFKSYRFDMVARHLYEFLWNDYCDWYLELTKCQLSGQVGSIATTQRQLIHILEQFLRLSHPIIPFITEEIWQTMKPLHYRPEPSLMLAPYPTPKEAEENQTAQKIFKKVSRWVEATRQLRSTQKINPATRVQLEVYGAVEQLAGLEPYLTHMAKLSEIKFIDLPEAQDTPELVIDDLHLRLLIPLDPVAEQARIEQLLSKAQSDLEKLQVKLSNPQFIERAPTAVVQQEYIRKQELDKTLKQLNEQWTRLVKKSTP